MSRATDVAAELTEDAGRVARDRGPGAADDPRFQTPEPTAPPTQVVTDDLARMLALHAIHVQGGFSDPATEKARAEQQIAAGDRIDFDRMQAELDAVLAGRPVAVEGDLDMPLIRRYKQLRDEENRLTAEGRAMKDEADRIEQQLVEMFSEAGTQNINVDGKTVYLHRGTFAQWQAGLTPETKRQALRDAGAGDLVTETINAQTLAAWVRELLEPDDDDTPAPGLPEPLAELLDLGERWTVRIKAAGSTPKRPKK